MAIVNAEFSFL